MILNETQKKRKERIKDFANLFGIDPEWAQAIAMVESALGLKQLSPTGCKGVFQMSSIAMKDLLQEMQKQDDDLIDIACGCAFLYLLLKRHKTMKNATNHFCDPNDISFYGQRVDKFMEEFKSTGV
jgi:hypothetical protein